MNAARQSQKSNPVEPTASAEAPRRPEVTEQDLDALRYTGVLRGTAAGRETVPSVPDSRGAGHRSGAGRSEAVPGSGCR